MRPQSIVVSVLLLACFTTAPFARAQETVAPSQTTPAAAAQPSEFAQPVVITGRLAGPRLWYIAKDDAEVFLLGTLSPLPADLEWDSQAVQSIINQVDAVYDEPVVRGGALDAARIVSLAVTTLLFRRDAIYLPDGKTLREISPELGARYAETMIRLDQDITNYKAAQRAARRGRPAPEQATPTERRLQSLREDAETSGRTLPYWLAMGVMAKGLESVGLGDRETTVSEEVSRLARRADVPVRDVRAYNFEASDIKRLLAAVRSIPMDKQLTCLSAALDLVDSDLPQLRARADAWSRGDVEALRTLPPPPQGRICGDMLRDQIGDLRSLGGAKPSEIDPGALYLEKLQEIMRKPGARLMVAPIDATIRPGGLVDRMREAGYEVKGP